MRAAPQCMDTTYVPCPAPEFMPPFARNNAWNYVCCVNCRLANLLVLSFLVPLWSHPHVFLDNSVAAEFDGNGLRGIRLKWVFDEMFTAMIAEQYDKNNDGAFDENEAGLLKAKAFDNLENFHFFTYLTLKGRTIPIDSIRDFRPTIMEEKLVYTFKIPCNIEWKRLKSELHVAVYDSTYFIDVAWSPEKPMAAVPDSLVEASFRKNVREDMAYYYDMIEVKEMVCKFKRRKNE